MKIEQIRAMDNTALRIKVAQLCGWNKPVSQTETRCIPDTDMCPPGSLLYYRLAEKIPDYPHDLNAMHEAEKLLHNEFNAALRDQKLHGTVIGYLTYLGKITSGECWSATALARAQAFVLTMEQE